MDWSLGQEAELSILSIIRRGPFWQRYQSIIEPGFFGDDDTRHLFQILQSYFEKYPKAYKLTVPDWMTLVRRYTTQADRRQRCIQMIRRIKKLKIPEERMIEETLVEFSRRQIVKSAVMEGINLLEQPELNLEKLRNYLDRADRVKGVVQSQFYDYFDSPNARIQDEVSEKRISTGIQELDELLDGGFGRGELAVFLGPPGRGKTLALVNIGHAALLQGLAVVHATMEISDRRTARRYDLRLTGRDLTFLKKNPKVLERKIAQIKEGGGDLIIKDFSSEHPKVEDLKAVLLNYLRRTKRMPGMVIVDYADLLHSSRGGKDHRFELKEIYDDLRRLAAELKVSIVTASQSTRKSLSNIVITIADFAEAFAKAAIADIVIGLCQTPEEEEDNLMRLHVAKSRQRPGHPTIRIACDPNSMFLGREHELRRHQQR
jgi:replicative DNA helicase